jgi:Flp pilus assembly protein TadD
VRAVEAAEDAERRRDHHAARARYQAAIAGAPDASSERFARRELADALLSWGELAAAERELTRVAALAPAEPAGWHDLGIVRANLGDEAGADQALARARALAPGDPRPRVALAALRWRRGDRAAARREYQELLQLDLPPGLRRKVEWALSQLAPPGG